MNLRMMKWCFDEWLVRVKVWLEIVWCAPISGEFYRVMDTSKSQSVLANDVIRVFEWDGVKEMVEVVDRTSIAFEMCYVPEDPESDEKAFRGFQAGCQDMGVRVQRGKAPGVMVVTARRDQLDHLAPYIFEEAEDNQLDVTMIAVEEGAE